MFEIEFRMNIDFKNDNVIRNNNALEISVKQNTKIITYATKYL